MTPRRFRQPFCAAAREPPLGDDGGPKSVGSATLWIGAKAGKSAPAEIVKQMAAQEPKHATAKAWRPRDYGDHPWCRAKQAPLYNNPGDQWVPLDQRTLCFFCHVPGYDLRRRCEHFWQCTANIRVAQNVPL